jgi:hypothetical protein
MLIQMIQDLVSASAHLGAAVIQHPPAAAAVLLRGLPPDAASPVQLPAAAAWCAPQPEGQQQSDTTAGVGYPLNMRVRPSQGFAGHHLLINQAGSLLLMAMLVVNATFLGLNMPAAAVLIPSK